MNAFVLGAVLGAIAVLVPLLIRLSGLSYCAHLLKRTYALG